MDITERKRAEEAVRDASEYAQNIVNTVREPLVVLDDEFRVISANRSFYSTFKVTTEMSENTLLFDLGDGQWEIPRLRELLEEVLPKSTTIEDFEVEHNFPDIGQKTMLLNARRIPEPPGEIQIILLAIEDITERKRAERQFQITQFEADQSDDMIIRFDRDGHVIYANEAAVRRHGYSKDEFLALSVWDITTYMSEENFGKIWQGLCEEGLSHLETEHVTSDGSTFPAEVTIDVLEFRGDRFGIAFARDITERKKAEEDVRQITDRLMLATGAANVGIWDWDVVNDTLVCDDVMYSLYGLTPDRFGGAHESWRSGLHPEDSSGADEAIQAALSGEKEYDIEFRVVWPDGSVHCVKANAMVQRDASGDPLHMIGTNWDITERKQALEELESANEELDSFSYSISHDLRAPLRAIEGFSAMLMEDHRESLDNEGQRLLGVVSEQTRKMGDLIDGLLRFSRTSREDLALAPVDMYALCGEVVAAFESQTGDREVTFNVEELPPAVGDYRMLKQVFENLIGNAVKFTGTREKAVIDVGFQREELGTTYFVRDNGVGFNMEYAGNIFGVFQRYHSEQEFEGTGIGLSLVQRIVAKHGGRVFAEAEEGRGATFNFYLPRLKEG